MPNSSYLMAKQVQQGLGLPKNTFTWPWPNKPVSQRPAGRGRSANAARRGSGRGRGAASMKKKAGIGKLSGLL